jgi:hypothetical protein
MTVADYYTHFSFAIEKLTDDERAWLRTLLAGAGDEPTEDLARLLSDPDYVGFSWAFEDDGSLWVYSDTSGTPEDAAALVQEFLSRFRPDDVLAFEWANTCSRPRLDAYGGGAVVVTAEEQRWMSSAQWLVEHSDRAARSDHANWSLREALACVAEHGFGANVDADSTIEEAAAGLVALYDRHGLHEVSGSSAADQCADLYALLCNVGLPVA